MQTFEFDFALWSSVVAAGRLPRYYLHECSKAKGGKGEVGLQYMTNNSHARHQAGRQDDACNGPSKGWGGGGEVAML